MFVGYLASANVGASSPYIFIQKYLTNNNIAYNQASGIFTINREGWYEINFSTSATGNGVITPTLYKNGVASTYELATMTSAGTTTSDYVNGSFSSVVYVAPTYNNTFATLQVVNNGVAATTSNAIITIKRIG